MKKWEYHTIVDHPHPSVNKGLTFVGALDVAGDDGWELVTVTPEADGYYAVAYLKRPATNS